jgi:hypothetical protein
MDKHLHAGARFLALFDFCGLAQLCGGARLGCKTHEFDKSMQSSTKSVGENMRKLKRCTEIVTQQSANGYSTAMHCDKDGFVTKTTMTYQGDTSYHMEMPMKDGQSET